MKLFDVEFVPPSVRKQINKFVDEYNYTYSGIQKSLIYFYEVKKNSIENARGMISIVPYIYQDAYRYYYSLWEARQKNERKQIKDYIPEVKEIIIPVPHTETKRRKLFSFLDEEE
jgi:starvation-inducible outer membrane lipoprotein